MMTLHKTITGLFFGSFNPVHTGHLIIADYFVQNTDIEKVWFVLSPQNPFKTGEVLLEEKSRMELLKLAICDNENFYACGVELEMERPSYSVDTIKKLKNDHPDHQFVLLIGSDNLVAFDRWKSYEKILEMIKIYVYPRRTGSESVFLSNPAVSLVNAPRIDISSTQIRDTLKIGKLPRYLLPDIVLKRISENNYYR